MIEAFYAPAREVLRREGLDVLGLEAIRDYYEALYRRQGHAALDRAILPDGETLAIIPAIRETARSAEFPFARMAQAFRLIDEAMDPVIIPYDDIAREAIRALTKEPFPPAGVRRRLQQYVVPVPPRARNTLLDRGAVQAIRPEEYGDRFMVLVEEKPGFLPELYDADIGLQIDLDPANRSAESNIFS
jgi:CRISPR-associated endonuclease/helicase Cas3